MAAAAKRYIRAAVKLAARGQFSKKDCECRLEWCNVLGAPWLPSSGGSTACALCASKLRRLLMFLGSPTAVQAAIAAALSWPCSVVACLLVETDCYVPMALVLGHDFYYIRKCPTSAMRQSSLLLSSNLPMLRSNRWSYWLLFTKWSLATFESSTACITQDHIRHFISNTLKPWLLVLSAAAAALVSASCKTLCHLSYVWPGAVLPLVLGRFQSALATATAMHQLPTAITSLAQCVRPLLLAGWHTDEESTPQVGGTTC